MDKKAAIISASSSSKDLVDKYKYLISKYLGLKPSTVEQAKFEYSPLGKIFNKGLKEEDKKEGLLKRLKNIEDKNEELLKTTKNKTENIKEITDFAKETLSPEAEDLIKEIKTIQKNVDYRKLKITGGNNVTYDFSDFKTFNDLSKDLYFKKMLIDDAEMKQNEFDAKLNALSRYFPKKQEYIEAKNKLLDNAKNFYEGRKKIIEGFKKGIFPLKSDDEFKEQARHENIRNENGLIDYNKFMELIKSKENEMNNELVKKYFLVQILGTLFRQMKDLKNNPKKTKKKKNNKLVNLMKSGLSDFKNDIEKMIEDEVKIEKPNEIVNIVENILEFNRQQQGKGLKILTPSQMLSRLPISLAQLQAGNNSQKLKNEIRQLLYSLYRSKNMTKQVYNNLIKYI